MSAPTQKPLVPGTCSNVVFNGIEYNTETEPKLLLQQERANSKLNIRNVTYYLDGGKAATANLETIMTSMEREPAFNQDDFYDLTKEQLREQSMRRVTVLNDALAAIPPTSADNDNGGTGNHHDIVAAARFALTGIFDPGTGTRMSVHFVLFYNTLLGNGTPQQIAYWNKKGAKTLKKFYGCFAMTELGHGSNVAGLETTATFDEKRDQFVINTPHLGATKWWIGGAAHTATHCLCYARLISKGRDHGVKPFVVPLRNLNGASSFTLKNGVAIGDIGKKMGRDGIDNGWIQFTNVRIPRHYMLMRYSQVDRAGNVSQLPLAQQLSYGALVGARVNMVVGSYLTSKRFLTIAVRYAAVRRQFSTSTKDPETRLLDYPYHQRRLMPRLAFCYAMNAGASEVSDMHRAAMAKLNSLNDLVSSSSSSSLAPSSSSTNTSSSDENKILLQESVLTDLKDLFGASAGLKTFCTWGCQEIIDQCRQACGGHGYSSYAGFGQGYNDWVVQCTWEGDNNLLTLSAGRALIQSVLAIQEAADNKGGRGRGKQNKGAAPLERGKSMDYIRRANELACVKLGTTTARNPKSLRDPAVLIEAWESAACGTLTSAALLYKDELKGNGGNVDLAFETISKSRFESARIHTRLYLVRAFFNRIAKIDDDDGGEAGDDTTTPIKPHLLNLAILFALWSMEQDTALFLQSGYLTVEETKQVTRLVDEYCAKVRDQAIPLTDAFNLSDFFINSTLGNYDGDVYRRYFEKVTLRGMDKNKDSKAPYYETVQKPYFSRPDE